MSRGEEAALKAYPKEIRDKTGFVIDIGYPQGIRDYYIEGYDQAEKDTIERACKWLFSHLPILVDYYNEDIHENADRGEFIKLFRTQMEEQ